MLSNCSVQSSAQLITATFSDVKMEWAELLRAFFFVVVVHIFCHNVKTENFGEDIQRRRMTADVLMSGARHLACTFSGRALPWSSAPIERNLQ